MNRQQKLNVVRKWLKKNGLTAGDIGVVGSLCKTSDDVLKSVIDDIDEDKAREVGRRYEEREGSEQMDCMNEEIIQ